MWFTMEIRWHIKTVNKSGSSMEYCGTPKKFLHKNYNQNLSLFLVSDWINNRSINLADDKMKPYELSLANVRSCERHDR